MDVRVFSFKCQCCVTNCIYSRHVVRDCTPYVCLFDECEQAARQYKTTDEWMEHMIWNHALSYSCKVPGHESFIFDSEDKLKEHLTMGHSGDYQEDELPRILETALTPCRDILSAFYGQNVGLLEANPPICILCGEGVKTHETRQGPRFQGELRNQSVQGHIAGHLESLALLALPADVTMNSEASDEDSKNLIQFQPEDGIDLLQSGHLRYSIRRSICYGQ
jgi:hypothetical protein